MKYLGINNLKTGLEKSCGSILTMVALGFLISGSKASARPENVSGLRNLPITGDAIVRETRGTPEVSYDGRHWNVLKKLQAVPAGSTIRASNESDALLWLEDSENFLKISPGTQISLGKPEAFAPTIASVKSEQVRGTAKVRAVRGRVELFENTGWKLLKVNSVLAPGSIIRSKANATADLFFPDNGLVVRMTPESVLRLDQLNFTWEGPAPVIQSLVVVAQGQIHTNADQNPENAKFKFQEAQVLYQIQNNNAVVESKPKQPRRFLAGDR